MSRFHYYSPGYKLRIERLATEMPSQSDSP